MNLRNPRFVAWAVPIACLSTSAILILERNATLGQAVAHAHRIEADLRRASAEDDALRLRRRETQFACAGRSPKEEPTFFTGLRRHAALANVAIVRLRSQSTTLGQDVVRSGPPSAAGAAPVDLTKGVTRVSCQLVLDGSYGDLRRFLVGLDEADRLYTFGEVTWGRAKNAARGGTELALTLNRYLSPAPASQGVPNT